MTTWREQLHKAMKEAWDSGPIVHLAPNPETFDIPFDDFSGGPEGPEILAFTAQRVYFPVVHDGAEWLGSAPRNPTDHGQPHIGGY